MGYKHIDPEPDCRYIIENERGGIDSAVVIYATNRHIRLRWDRTGDKKWYPFNSFQSTELYGNPEVYPNLRILERIGPER